MLKTTLQQTNSGKGLTSFYMQKVPQRPGDFHAEACIQLNRLAKVLRLLRIWDYSN